MDARQGGLRDAGSPLPRDANPDQIERAIDHTRGRMDDIVDAIQEKLSVRGWGGMFVDMLSSGAGVGSRRAMQGIRDNPVPAMLAGLAVTWLLADRAYSRRGPRRHGEGLYNGPYGEPRRQAGGVTAGVGDAVRSAAHTAGEWASAAGHGVSSAASAVGETASDIGSKVREGVGAAGHAASRAAEQIAGTTRHAAERAGRAASHAYEENPLAVGLAAFAVGLAGGIAFPTTRAENRIMGRASRDLKEKAADLGAQAAEVGKRVAVKAARAARESATEDAPGLGGRLANVVEATAGAVAGEVRQTGGTGLSANQPRGAPGEPPRQVP